MNIALINHLEEENKGYYTKIVERAKFENLKDIILTLKRCKQFNNIILQTNNPSRYKNFSDILIEDTSKIPEFGIRISSVLNKFKGSKLFYTGSGSSTFLSPQEINNGLKHLKPNNVIANNLYSSDYFFIYSRKDILAERIESDNAYSRYLIDRYGFKGIEIKRDEFTLFDIDGPLDLLALKITEKGGPNLRKYIKNIRLRHKNIKNMLLYFTQRDVEIFFWGRISEFLIQFLRYRTACKTKFIIEGRGLFSQSNRELYSIFYDALFRAGDQFLLNNLHKYCNAVILDSRILFAHQNLKISKEDRFALDMLDIDRIKNPHIKRLCKMALKINIPILFCNHSFLNSGIPLLVDYTWRKKGFRDPQKGNGIVKDIIALRN